MEHNFVTLMQRNTRTFILEVLLILIKCLNSVKGMIRGTDSGVVTPFNPNFELKRTPEEIKHALTRHKIIPDLLDKAPNETIYVEWIGGPCAKLGNEITEIHELEPPPLWVNYKNSLQQMHTMMMIGLDEPSAQNRSSSLFLYWLVSNIPPHNYDNVPGTDYVRGETIVEYREPIPLQGTGLHRYVFLAFPQGNRTINVTMPKLEYCNVTQRLHFDLRHFGKKYNLGESNAANFFVAQWHRVMSHNESIST